MTNDSRARRSRVQRVRVPAVLAGLISLAATAAPAADVWVGTRNPQTGQITVRTDVLKGTFADGTPVGSFAIQEVADGLLGVPNGFLLVRRTAPGGITCRTEATAVKFSGFKAYVDLDLLRIPVLLCANPVGVTCGSCRIERNLEGYYCACIKNGSIAGECEGRINDLLKQDFILDWLDPIPEPDPDPR
jgi:hypothetical protein